jgi:hypothetical protein
MNPENIEWDQVINKKARGIDECDLGKVQRVTPEFVLTKKGLADKKLLKIPKKLALSFDGSKVIFRLQEYDISSFEIKETELDEESIAARETPVSTKENILNEKSEINQTEETKPNLQLIYEELVIEQKRLSKPQKINYDEPQSNNKINIPLKREVILHG